MKSIKLIKETEDKLNYYVERYQELTEQLNSGKLTDDCCLYVRGEIKKAMKNVSYYKEVLDILEGLNGNIRKVDECTGGTQST